MPSDAFERAGKYLEQNLPSVENPLLRESARCLGLYLGGEERRKADIWTNLRDGLEKGTVADLCQLALVLKGVWGKMVCKRFTERGKLVYHMYIGAETLSWMMGNTADRHLEKVRELCGRERYRDG